MNEHISTLAIDPSNGESIMVPDTLHEPLSHAEGTWMQDTIRLVNGNPNQQEFSKDEYGNAQKMLIDMERASPDCYKSGLRHAQVKEQLVADLGNPRTAATLVSGVGSEFSYLLAQQGGQGNAQELVPRAVDNFMTSAGMIQNTVLRKTLILTELTLLEYKHHFDAYRNKNV